MITRQQTLLRIQFGVVAAYIMVKFFFKPMVLKNESLPIFKIFVLSFPNFCEAIVGSIVVTFMLLFLNDRMTAKLKEKKLYLIAVLLAGVYVILQEFKVHNLGGNNVYDPYDVLFSVLGLGIAFYVLNRLNPKIIARNS